MTDEPFDPLVETKRLAAREEPMSPGQKVATEAADKGLQGWLRRPAWLRRFMDDNPGTDAEPKDSGSWRQKRH
jgi:hypothetical protein